LPEDERRTTAPAWTPENPPPDRLIVPLLAAIAAAGPVALNIYLPALPAVQQAFAASVSDVQLTLSVALLAFATSLLFYGPASDRFGRRPVLLVGIGLFLLGTLLCLVAPSLGLLIAGRAIQSIGMAAGFIISRAIVSDLYPTEKMARMIAYLTMVMVVGPTVAPFIGGLLVAHYGWHSLFVALLGAGALIFWMAYGMIPETRAPRETVLTVGDLLRAAGSLLRRPAFVGYAFQGSAVFAVFIVFISITPYVMVQGLGRPPTEYGLYYLLIAVGYFLGNLAVTRLHGRGTRSLMAAGVSLSALSALVALGLHEAGFHHPLAIFLPMFTLTIGQGLTLPNVTANAVSLAPEHGGTAASLLAFIQQIFGAACVQWMARFPVTTPRAMLVFCVGISVIACLLLLPLMRQRVTTTEATAT
jgi:DHA1 family bicyclomycin/chloramphenicol resistance-like MFS transporter